jgi:2-C-methyl-D-erythritol 4-phosphate cytidylyltransferase
VSSSPDGRPRAAAVVVAGGAGRRVGGELPKQFLEVGGVPILLRATLPFLGHPAVRSVIVVLPAEYASTPPPWLDRRDLVLVAGGAERSDSVRNGLLAVPPDVETVLIHDGARPFVSRAVIDRVLGAAAHGPAIAAIPAADTIKEVDASRRIVGTPDRARLWQAQTPQGFPRDLLLEAHRRARVEAAPATDDAALLERMGVAVHVVEGAPENIKITRPVDLVFAEALAAHLAPG